jgi:hypothetical protein
MTKEEYRKILEDAAIQVREIIYSLDDPDGALFDPDLHAFFSKLIVDGCELSHKYHDVQAMVNGIYEGLFIIDVMHDDLDNCLHGKEGDQIPTVELADKSGTLSP